MGWDCYMKIAQNKENAEKQLKTTSNLYYKKIKLGAEKQVKEWKLLRKMSLSKEREDQEINLIDEKYYEKQLKLQRKLKFFYFRKPYQLYNILKLDEHYINIEESLNYIEINKDRLKSFQDIANNILNNPSPLLKWEYYGEKSKLTESEIKFLSEAIGLVAKKLDTSDKGTLYTEDYYLSKQKDINVWWDDVIYDFKLFNNLLLSLEQELKTNEKCYILIGDW